MSSIKHPPSKKRKAPSSARPAAAKPSPKKPKRDSHDTMPAEGNDSNKGMQKKLGMKPSQDKNKQFKHTKGNKFSSVAPKEPMSKRELRLAAKEKAEARKRRRKPHYSLEQELASLWERMRCRGIAKEERSKLISEALRKMTGKIPEIATSHVSSRILQTCVNYCSQEEKAKVFEELRPHLLTLSTNAYAVHLVKKIVDNASKTQFEWFISSLHGHVASLLRHMVGSVVIEHAFQLGNGHQKKRLLLELYSTELQLFKDLTFSKEGRLLEIISKLGLKKSAVLQHMSSVLQPILEKGIVDHSIIHSALMEYFTIADKSSALDVLQQISGPLLVRMLHTKDGSKVGILCIKHGSSKERKKIVKGMKGLIGKISLDHYGSLVLMTMLSSVDDTKLLTKIVIRELQTMLTDLLFDQIGRRPLLQLLNPHCRKYLSPADVDSLNLYIPSLCNRDMDDHMANENVNVKEHDDDPGVSENCLPLPDVGKKDPALRQYELLVTSELAENLISTCIDNVGPLLKSNYGKDVLYEVCRGGSDSILFETLSEKLGNLHEAIASLAACQKGDLDEEHVFENFHSSRTIRKLVIFCPTFATRLWETALKGRCKMWAQGHSLKVVSAYLESSDSEVQELARPELQPLVDAGVFKALEVKKSEKES